MKISGYAIRKVGTTWGFAVGGTAGWVWDPTLHALAYRGKVEFGVPTAAAAGDVAIARAQVRGWRAVKRRASQSRGQTTT